MKVCPYCKHENDDRHVYCANCYKELPKETRIENLVSIGVHALEKRDYRTALKKFSEVLKLNIGHKEAWLLKGIAATYLKMTREAGEAFKRAGVRVSQGRCEACGGFGKCYECGSTGRCYMCKGSGRCMNCNGTGLCHRCNGDDPNCRVCKGTGKCVRCKGTKECAFCEGTGVCPKCQGDGRCLKCGGTGKALKADPSQVPRKYHKYLLK